MTADDVKDALRRRHPSLHEYGGPGAWTCLEEFMNIDLLAIAAWTQPKPARVSNARIAYEVKVSRGDMRAELLNPTKRQWAVRHSHEFYFAVPHGMLTPYEITWDEPEWEAGDFTRTPCPNRCCRPDRRYRHTRGLGTGRTARAHGPVTEHVARWGDRTVDTWIVCDACTGAGYLAKSRVEQDAPTLWVPADCGLIEVTDRGVCKVVKRSPINRTPEPLREKTLNELVRWASFRPDRRHLEIHQGGGADSAREATA